MTSNNNLTGRLVSRLKAEGLIPRKDCVRIKVHYSHKDPIKWEAVNAITGEPYRVGGDSPVTETVGCFATVRRDGDWAIFVKGGKLPREEIGGVGMVEGLRKGWVRS